ncbi:DNA (cytosine-5)-methyltransferase CMT2-like isoform X2 [Durio zibethinus]|uniref:DNA (cytosine-5-)-methyltransferase n=1 Tax=Durio zibethinus TaxID=66656 RepID=A0A6P5Y7P0_DURZI|nr:DNA (cytosine-5)-methyltransferase CMT2-like isoform X2 [Durio zibethinus]
MKPSKKSESEFWSLSLVESEDGNEEQPVPLDICLPQEMTADIKLPPSLLQVSPVQNVPSRKSDKKTVHISCLRRSPRLSVLFGPQPPNVGPIVRVQTQSNRMKNTERRIVDDKSLRRSPRFTSFSAGAENVKTLFLPLKSQSSKSGSFKLIENKKAKVMNVKVLRRSPRLTSASTETKADSSKTKFKSPEKVSYSETRSSGKLIDELLYLSWPEDAGKGSVPSMHNDPNFSDEKQRRKSPRFVRETDNWSGNESIRKFEVHNSRLSIEKQLRKSMKIGRATKNGCINVSIRRLDTQEIGFSGEKLLGMSPSFMQATENGDSDVSFREHRREMCDEKQLKLPFSCPTSLDGVGRAEVNSSFIGSSNSWDEHPFKKFKVSSVDSDMRMSDEKFSKKIKDSSLLKKKQTKHRSDPIFVGSPIPDDEAQERWHWRYEMKNIKSKSKSIPLDDDDEDKIVWNVECHYVQAEVDGCAINLGDCVYIKGEEAKHHIGRILEFFKTTDGENYFRVQWFYRAEDTVMKQETSFHDERRLFYSTVMNDNPMECIISKVTVTQISPKLGLKSNSIPQSDFYFDMEYCVEYSTFRTLPTDDSFKSYSSSNCCKEILPTTPTAFSENIPSLGTYKAELALLDLYAGCGGMSTGLCLGAKATCIDLVTKWAIDNDKSACKSLKLNHPETHVRNEAADDFLLLLKEWKKLCKRYAVDNVERYPSRSTDSQAVWNDANSPKDADTPPGEFEVSSLVDICYGDPCNTGNRGLNFKVRWKGYSASEDTWEPIEGLSNCQECIQDFVRKGFKSKILPLRGDVDIICGGPPCQGISGYNRYRNVDSPLDDERNRQIVVFMDIVEYLKPKFVLMENVVDILRFDKASLGRYALSRLVHMKYQSRLGIIAAGCYGLPQFRLRVFLWGAHPGEKLPQFPLPTHDVIIRYWPPPEFERNTVAYDEDQPRELEDALVLSDAISDLPAVTNNEAREEMTYGKPPETDFQRYIRSSEYEMTGFALNGATRILNPLYDHRPSPLTEDDYTRVCLIPKRKGANFRDLPGIIVGKDNVARRDPTQEKQLLPSGKPLVPDYVFTFEQGKSKRPFARLWWDETVPTVVTYPYCHSQAALHPEQDRVLTIREYARLQGFPDYYRFCGTIKERYCQIGNAVAVPVARALGYAMGMAVQKQSGNEPLMTLSPKFSLSTNLQLVSFM